MATQLATFNMFRVSEDPERNIRSTRGVLDSYYYRHKTDILPGAGIFSPQYRRSRTGEYFRILVDLRDAV